MERKQLLLVGLGVPAWVLGIVLLVSGFVANFLYYLAVLIALYFAVLHGGVHHRDVQVVKVGVVFLLIHVISLGVMVQNPSLWGSQVARNLDKGRLIQPHSPAIEELRVHFDEFLADEPEINETWHWATFADAIQPDNYRYGYYDLASVNYSVLSNFERLLLVDFYVRNNTIEWTSDGRVYGVMEYKGTPAEVLRDKNYSDPSSRARDDCDGITVVIVSLLELLDETGWMNCSPWIGSGKSHWYPVAYLPERSQPIFLYFWRTIHAWAFFNGANQWRLAQPLETTIVDVLFYDDADGVEAVVAWVVDHVALSLLVLAGVALGLVLVCRYPRRPREKMHQEKHREKQQEKEKVKVNAGSAGQPHDPNSMTAPASYKTRDGSWLQRLNPFQHRYWPTWWSVACTFGLALGLVLLLLGIISVAPGWWFVVLLAGLAVIARLLVRDAFTRLARHLTRATPGPVGPAPAKP